MAKMYVLIFPGTVRT